MKKVLNIVFCVFLICALFSCNALTKVGGGDGSGDDISFWVTLNLDTEVQTKYKAVRVQALSEDNAKIGTSNGPFNDKFKVSVPESAITNGVIKGFSVEFTREISMLDNLRALDAAPAAKDILKAFHYNYNPDPMIELADGAEIQIPPASQNAIGVDAGFAIGFSDGSLDLLEKIPNVPPLYKLDWAFSNYLKENSDIPSDYYALFAVVTDAGKKPDFGAMTNFEVDPNNVLGYGGGDDWYLILNEERVEGSRLRFWMFFRARDDAENYPTRIFYSDDFVLPEKFKVVNVTVTDAAIPIVNESQLTFLAWGLLGSQCSDTDYYLLTQDVYDMNIEPDKTLPPPYILDGNLWNKPWPGSLPSIVGLFNPGWTFFNNFKGTFDGLDAEIQLYLTAEVQPSDSPTGDGKRYYGFFSQVTNATIRNVSIYIMDSLSPMSGVPYYDVLGGLAGKISGQSFIKGNNVDALPPYGYLDEPDKATQAVGAIGGMLDPASTESGNSGNAAYNLFGVVSP